MMISTTWKIRCVIAGFTTILAFIVFLGIPVFALHLQLSGLESYLVPPTHYPPAFPFRLIMISIGAALAINLFGKLLSWTAPFVGIPVFEEELYHRRWFRLRWE